MNTVSIPAARSFDLTGVCVRLAAGALAAIVILAPVVVMIGGNVTWHSFL